MDVFIEKIVAKKKSTSDIFFAIGIILGGFVAIYLALTIPKMLNIGPYAFFFGPIAGFLVLFGMYYFITSKNIEFEYSLTNGDLDIDRIVAQRRRKRLFSGNCKDFELVAKLDSDHYTSDIKNIQNIINTASEMDSTDVYFIVLNYKGTRTVVFFEPDKRMIETFKVYIPRKVFE